MKHWWVPGLQIGYEHTFIHQVADFLEGARGGKPAARRSARRSRPTMSPTRSCNPGVQVSGNRFGGEPGAPSPALAGEGWGEGGGRHKGPHPALRATFSREREKGRMKRILVVGTADTKGEELAYLRSAIADAGAVPIVVDVGIGAPSCAVDIPRNEVAGEDADKILAGRDRGAAVTAMGEAFATFLTRFDAFDGIIGIGGGGGTSIITRGMRALPIGRPKLMVSTLASGDVSPFVDVSDITMTPSITDLAGLNSVSRMVLRNAAFAIAGMASAASRRATASLRSA